MFFTKLFATKTSGYRSGTGSTTAPASNAHTKSVLHDHDVMMLVMQKMDQETAMNMRVVCKFWRSLVKEAKLEPLEAGCSEQQMKLGLENQQRLEEALALENEVWTAAHTANLAQHLTNQEEITAKMRHELVNWLMDVLFKSCPGVESCLYLTIQLLDLFLAKNVVARSEFQTVGVAAFALACEHKDLSCYRVSDLSYITDYSSSTQNINNMKKEMYRQLMKNMNRPNPAHYLPRFSQAGNLEYTNHTNDGYSKFSSIILYFIDMALLNETLVHTRPSLIAAAAIMCTLRVLGRSDWSAQLKHYTTYTHETVAALADTLIANGGVCSALLDNTQIANDRAGITWAIKNKYTSQRFGGVGDVMDPDGKTLNDGCLHMLCDCYETYPLTAVPVSRGP